MNGEAEKAGMAGVGAKMLKRGDVIGALRKRLAQLHAEADQLGAEGSLDAHNAVRKRIAGFMEVLTMLQSFPYYFNPTDLRPVTED